MGRYVILLAAALLLSACCGRSPCCVPRAQAEPEVVLEEQEAPEPSPAAKKRAQRVMKRMKGAVHHALRGVRADEQLDQLTRWMTGVFSSGKQAAEDPTYFDIRLAMVRIWRDREDGVWLYVEQATAAAVERPYRQRVYRLRWIGADLFESKVFALPDAKARAGTWEDPASFDDLAPDDLDLLTGCAVLLRRKPDGSFSGSTLGSQCKNSFGNAKYATSEVTVTEEGIVSWDRGYAAEGKQVWGAEKAGYVFDKVRDLDP